jgi:hypothetical protein
MADLLIAVLCVAVALAALLSLTDSWIAGRHALGCLMAERALAQEGFGPPLVRSDLAQRRMRAVAPTARSCAARSQARGRVLAPPPLRARGAA